MNKRIVVLGAGESGAGAAVLAKVKGFDVFVSDMSLIKDAYKAFGHGAALSFCDAGVAGRFPTKTVCYEIVAHRHEFCKGVI